MLDARTVLAKEIRRLKDVNTDLRNKSMADIIFLKSLVEKLRYEIELTNITLGECDSITDIVRYEKLHSTREAFQSITKHYKLDK